MKETAKLGLMQFVSHSREVTARDTPYMSKYFDIFLSTNRINIIVDKMRVEIRVTKC